MLDLETGRIIGPLNVRNVAVENDFYTINGDAGPDDGIEQVLAGVESWHALGLARLPRQFPPDPETRAYVALFVALQFVRTRAWRDESLEGQGSAFKEIGRFRAGLALRRGPGSPEWEWLRATMGADDDQTVRQQLEWAEQGDYSVTFGPEMHLSQMLDILSDPEVSRMIVHRAWSLLRTTERTDFVTSDNPIGVYGFGPVGLGTADSVALPLSPDWLLRLTLSPADEGKRRLVSAASVEGYNEATARQAKRFVYGHPTSRSTLVRLADRLRTANN